jgi:prepilin-type N-terminal cleavage/methylation domain-containing protein
MRRGLTLLEVLVVIAIIAVLLALLVPAVQSVRVRALLTQSNNNLRQIGLAFHAIADNHNGELPGCVPARGTPYRKDPLVSLLPFLEETNVYNKYNSLSLVRANRYSYRMQVAVYLNPLDRSFGSLNPNFDPFEARDLPKLSVSSYALNEQFFGARPRLALATDGLSQTIWLSEHYGWNCNGTTFFYTLLLANLWTPFQPPTFAHTMADGRPSPGDYYPITTGNPPQSAAEGGVTFQMTPSMTDCDPRLPNASYSGGLQVALGDGSVRILAPSISPLVFWGAVTPNKGEVISLD